MLDFADPGAELVAHAESDPPAASSGSVLVAVNAMRRDVTVRLTRLYQEMTAVTNAQRELKNKVSAIGAELTAGLDSLKELTQDFGVAPVREMQQKKRIPKVPLRFLTVAAGPKRAVAPMLTWTIIVTVVSFIHAMPALRFWVSDTLWNNMAPFAEMVSASQGFSVIMFSARNNSKLKLSTKTGQLWLFVLRGP